MHNITFLNQKKMLELIKNGTGMAVFTIDESGNAGKKISDIILHAPLPSDKSILSPALTYINENFNKDIKIETLSGLCDISSCYFSRLFSKTFKTGFKAYIIKLRLDNAKQLLQYTNRSVVSIALECGYVDCGYFNKTFKKHVGCTPLQYRHDKNH